MNSSFSLSRFGVISRISSAAVIRVLGRVERRELVAERQLVAVLLDELADVVALERRPGSRGTDRSPSCTTRTSRCRGTPRSPRRTPSPSRRRDAARACTGHCSRRYSKYGYGSATSASPRKKSIVVHVDSASSLTAPLPLTLCSMISSYVRPSSSRTSSVCSPCSGAPPHRCRRLVELHRVRRQHELGAARRGDRLEVAVGDRLRVVVHLERRSAAAPTRPSACRGARTTRRRCASRKISRSTWMHSPRCS